MAWLRDVCRSNSDMLHILSQHGPSSASARLLDCGYLSALDAADDWEKFRLGLVLVAHGSGKDRNCCLCRSGSFGMAHLLASCGAVGQERSIVLAAAGVVWAASLLSAPPQDWCTSLLSAHLEISRLPASVHYVSRIVGLIKANPNQASC